MQKLIIDSEFKAFIPPLTEAEASALEMSILAAGGAHTPIDTWRGVIVDGHNRYDICQRLGLPYQTREREFADRAAVKAWMFAHQIARRNLSVDQVVMLAALRGVSTTTGTLVQRERAAVVAQDEARAARVLSGTLSIKMAWNGVARERGLLQPRAPRGPSTKPCIPIGHELKGVSTLTNEAGDISSQWNKTHIASALEPQHDPVPEGHQIKKTSTLYGPDGSVRSQWVSSSADEIAREKAMVDAWARHAEVYRGLAGTSSLPVRACDNDIVTVYPLGDPHVGMMAWAPEAGENFDTKIACSELLACVRMLVASAPPSAEAIICNLGDFMHAQDDSNMTPGHGNQLQVDGRFAKVLDAGHTLLRGIVDAALEKHARVKIRNLPGNHDPRVAAELAMWLRAVYERDPRVTVADAYAAHQYDRFGCNLFGWHHGDRSKASELPAIMATDRPDDWGHTTDRVWHVGHVHHLTRLETPGCIVETHRTMAAKDAWHAGRYRAGRSLAAIGYHMVYGEVTRNTVGIKRVRAEAA